MNAFNHISLPSDLVNQYADVIAKNGPDSLAALELRKLHANNVDFIAYANSLDLLKSHTIDTYSSNKACK